MRKCCCTGGAQRCRAVPAAAEISEDCRVQHTAARSPYALLEGHRPQQEPGSKGDKLQLSCKSFPLVTTSASHKAVLMRLPHVQLVLLQPALLSSFSMEAALRPRLAFLCDIAHLPAESIGPVIVRLAPSTSLELSLTASSELHVWYDNVDQ